MKAHFRDRRDAGRQLARELEAYAGRDDVLVLGLPRGGVPVAFEVALHLDAPLDVFLVRKLGVPGHRELAMGAIASGNVRVINREVVDQLGIGPDRIEQVAEEEERELQRRLRLYRGERPEPDLEGQTVILVDDGLATGATMRAAITAARKRNPRELVVGVPTAAAATCDDLADSVDRIFCVITPSPFYGVGLWYQDFAQTSDSQVRDLLAAGFRRSLTREDDPEPSARRAFSP